MKVKSIILIAALVLTASCAKRKFNKNIVGFWSAYEIVNVDGSLHSDKSLNFRTVFGVYNPHIQLKSDKSYVPFSRDSTGIILKTTEAGTYTYNSKSSELSLKGGMTDMTFAVEKFDGDELWLKSLTINQGIVIKLTKDKLE